MLERLEALSNIYGVSGDEKRVRKYLRAEAAPLCDETFIDAMGNLYAHKKGAGPRVLVCAHMDEVGMMVSSIQDNGMLTYVQSGIDPRVVVSKRVAVGDAGVPGVIGSKAIHLQSEEEFKRALEHKELFIDIGAKDRADAEKLVKKGDYVCFTTKFSKHGDGLMKGKALDDRAGCAILLELLKGRYDADLYAAFTVQEEVGLRGAMVVAANTEPDLCLIFEGTTANDMPECEPYEAVTRVGFGPAISVMDRRTIVNPKLYKALIACADREGIPFQIRQGTTGANDAGSIHNALSGCVTGAISVPCRYIHSPCSVASVSDLENAFRLADRFLATNKFREVLCNE